MNFKKKLAFLFAFMFALPMAFTQHGDISAEELIIGDSNITDTSDFIFNEDTLTITKYIGDDLEVTIPTEINGKKVRGIGNEAFNGNIYIKRVIISNTVISIEGATFNLTGNGAFGKCIALKEVVFEEGSNISVIGCRAFDSCSSLEKITIPDSLTTIEKYAFNNCSTLKSMTIPKNVTFIGEQSIGYQDGNKINDFVIYGENSSQAELYAQDNGFYFNDMPVSVKGDLTNDGKVNSADLLKLKKYLLGLIDTLD